MSDLELKMLIALAILAGAWALIKLIQAVWNAWEGKDL